MFKAVRPFGGGPEHKWRIKRDGRKAIGDNGDRSIRTVCGYDGHASHKGAECRAEAVGVGGRIKSWGWVGVRHMRRLLWFVWCLYVIRICPFRNGERVFFGRDQCLGVTDAVGISRAIVLSPL